MWTIFQQCFIGNCKMSGVEYVQLSRVKQRDWALIKNPGRLGFLSSSNSNMLSQSLVLLSSFARIKKRKRELFVNCWYFFARRERWKKVVTRRRRRWLDRRRSIEAGPPRLPARTASARDLTRVSYRSLLKELIKKQVKNLIFRTNMLFLLQKFSQFSDFFNLLYLLLASMMFQYSKNRCYSFKAHTLFSQHFNFYATHLISIK
jgi:hypothetical protein